MALRGVWRRPLSEMIVGVEPKVDELPGQYLLSQNYPNPFNPSTTIMFELQKSSNVRLVIYDILGREVMVLVAGSRDAGIHRVTFTGSNLASGVYLCRLSAGNLVQIRTILLSR